jgi:hypothetical protein
MLFIKLVLFVAVCYIISKGLVIDYELETKKYKEEINSIKIKAKKEYTIMEVENKILRDTINQLKIELYNYKKR